MKGWKFYDLETSEIFVSQDVEFYESIFPFSIISNREQQQPNSIGSQAPLILESNGHGEYINPLDTILQLRRYLIMEESNAPQEWNSMFSNVENNFAPWKFAPDDRDAWAAELENGTSNT